MAFVYLRLGRIDEDESEARYAVVPAIKIINTSSEEERRVILLLRRYDEIKINIRVALLYGE